jgi:subtilisin
MRKNCRIHLNRIMTNKWQPASQQSALVPWGVSQVGATELWPHFMGQGVSVAIIDTGIHAQHPDLKDAVGIGFNVLRPGTAPRDDNGHGTHIAGTIAAYGRKAGIIGVAPATTIHPVKAFDGKGTAYVADIISGIEWCVANRIPIINMSFGIHENSPSLRRAVLNAYRQGSIIIASAGNDGNEKKVDYPAQYDEVVGVGAINRANQLAAFSNNLGRIDLYAPGVAIDSCHRLRSYRTLSGTSMAAAHVSGALAQLMSALPRHQPQALLLALQQTATPLASSKPSSAGALNVSRAYRWLTGAPLTHLTSAPAH